MTLVDEPRPFDPDAVIDAMAPLLGLTIAPDDRPGVATNLTLTAGLATLVLDFKLDQHTEPAAVFHP